MLDSSDRKLWTRLAVMVSILYSITIGVYFIWFYKPYGIMYSDNHMAVLEGINHTIKSINRTNMVFFLIFSFLVSVFVSIIILRIHEEVIYYAQSIIEVEARLKLQKAYTRMNISPKFGITTVSTSYKLVFEVGNGNEMIFHVTPKHYVTILEGNKGILKYKEGRINRYIGFDIKEIE